MTPMRRRKLWIDDDDAPMPPFEKVLVAFGLVALVIWIVVQLT
jgi:hypothetical protein